MIILRPHPRPEASHQTSDIYPKNLGQPSDVVSSAWNRSPSCVSKTHLFGLLHASRSYLQELPESIVLIVKPRTASQANSAREENQWCFFNQSKLKSESDWTKRDEMVFEAQIKFETDSEFFLEIPRNELVHENNVLVTSEGVLPNMRYVVREKGKVELRFAACAHCHTRVMPDGSVIKGAQGNFPDNRTFGYQRQIEEAKAKNKEKVLEVSESLSVEATVRPGLRVVRVRGQIKCQFPSCSLWKRSRRYMRAPGQHPFYPFAIPNMIGLKYRKYLNRQDEPSARDR